MELEPNSVIIRTLNPTPIMKGQKVGMLASIVEVEHKKTGLTAIGKGERSTTMNRDKALKLLQIKLNNFLA